MLAAVLGLAAMAGGCSRGDPDASLGYLPARAGMRWEYEITVATQAGSGTRRLIVESGAARQQDGRRFLPRRSGDGSVTYYEERSDGIWRVAELPQGEDGQWFEHGEKLLGYPLKAGTAWRAPERTIVLEKHTPPHGNLTRIEVALDLDYRIEATDDTIIVPAGRFDHCVRVHAVGTASREVGLYIGTMNIRIEVTRWYAPGVGLIKAVRRETTSEPTLPFGEYTLILHRLNQ